MYGYMYFVRILSLSNREFCLPEFDNGSYNGRGELAQLAERVLSMHEVAGSIPAFSILFCVGVV